MPTKKFRGHANYWTLQPVFALCAPAADEGNRGVRIDREPWASRSQAAGMSVHVSEFATSDDFKFGALPRTKVAHCGQLALVTRASYRTQNRA